MTDPKDRRGFPKKLPCLVCGKLRRASWPGDRIHEECRVHTMNDAMLATLAPYHGSTSKERAE